MEDQIHQSWWKRNWKWALPTGGCLTIIIVVISVISYGVYKATDFFSENSSLFAFVGVIQEVQQNEEVQTAIGTPIRFDDMEDDTYDPTRDQNKLDLDFEIQGQNSDATVRVIANKTEDGWHYTTFTVTVEDTGKIIDLKDQANE